MSRHSPGSAARIGRIQSNRGGKFRGLHTVDAERCDFRFESGLQISPFSRLIQLIVPAAFFVYSQQWRKAYAVYIRRSQSRRSCLMIFITMWATKPTEKTKLDTKKSDAIHSLPSLPFSHFIFPLYSFFFLSYLSLSLSLSKFFPFVSPSSFSFPHVLISKDYD